MENVTSQIFLEFNFTQNFTISNSECLNSTHSIFSPSTNKLLLPTWWKLLDEKYLFHSICWTIALIIAYLVILVIGVIGNVLVILVVLLRPKMRSVTNIFIMNLAVADLFVIVFCVAGTLLSHVLAPWILGSITCKCIAFAQSVSVCASAYSLAAISVDRWKAIYNSYGRSNGLTKHQCFLVIAFIWISSLFLTVPWAAVFDVAKTEYNGNTYSCCVENWSDEFLGNVNFIIVNFVICYCLPVLLISISNLIIWCHVKHRKVPLNSDSTGCIREMHRKARNGVLKMLGVVTLVFILSWMPLYVLVMRIKFGENISESEYGLHGILMPFSQWLGSWSCSVNPILYAFLNKKFRKMFKSLLPSCLTFEGLRKRNFIATDKIAIKALKSSLNIFTLTCNSSIEASRQSSRKYVDALDRNAAFRLRRKLIGEGCNKQTKAT